MVNPVEPENKEKLRRATDRQLPNMSVLKTLNLYDQYYNNDVVMFL